MAWVFAVWSLFIAPRSQAGGMQPGAAPAAPDEVELQELVVRARRQVQVIADAEDEFFALFNQLNLDDDYDTSCVYLQVDPSSKIPARVCLPGFVAEAMADWAEFKLNCTDFSSYDANGDARISRHEAAASVFLSADFPVLDINHDGYLGAVEYGDWNYAQVDHSCYHPPPPELVLMEGTRDWYEHSMKVIRSEPRLQTMAGHLDDLYHDLWTTKRQLLQEEAERKALQSPRKPVRGPRAG
jgi:hypothetical protein